MTSAPGVPDPDPTLLGRVYLLVRAVVQNGVASTDDALLVGELHGKRTGNVKLCGAAAAEAHRRGWVRPVAAGERAAYASRKSIRTRRASGSVQLWTATSASPAALESLRRLLTKPPKPRGLFDGIE